jgi:type VI protein secretion system component VasK
VAGTLKGFSVTLKFDGRDVEFAENSTLQRSFSWPTAPSATAEAKAWTTVGGGKTYFGSSNGLWGVFQVFRDADKRELGSTQVQWSDYAVAGGGREKFDKPVMLEFVRSQGAAELLNPKFFEGLRCPGKAVQ